MTPDTTSLDYQISVMQACNRGAKIERRNRYVYINCNSNEKPSPRVWGLIVSWGEGNPIFDWEEYEYRIAEEPREPRRGFINFYSNGVEDWAYFHSNRKLADEHSGDYRIGEAVEFVEVL